MTVRQVLQHWRDSASGMGTSWVDVRDASGEEVFAAAGQAGGVFFRLDGEIIVDNTSFLPPRAQIYRVIEIDDAPLADGPKTCSLCGKEFNGYGHNPEPLADFTMRCCDMCNTTRVISARLRELMTEEREHPEWTLE